MGESGMKLHITDSGAVFKSDDFSMTLHIVREPDDARLAHVTSTEGGDVHAALTLRPVSCAGWCWIRAATSRRGCFGSRRRSKLHDETERFWKSWLAQSTYTGRWREALQRSAITLKLMTYAPTGCAGGGADGGAAGAGRRGA